MNYGYVYKFTFLPTGKFYVGQHKYSGDSLDELYWGSGLLWKRTINEYISKLSKDELKTFNYDSIIKREVLEYCNDALSLNESERYWINKLNAQNSEIAYNVVPGGSGGCKDCSWYNDGVNEYYVNTNLNSTIPKNWIKGRLKDKFKNVNVGSIWINNGVEQKYIKLKDADTYIKSGWNRGMLYRGDEWRSHIGKYERSPEVRKIYADNALKTILDGRNPGWIANQFKKGDPAFNKNMIWITNGCDNKYINNEDNIPDGWYKGCTQARKNKVKVINIDTNEIFESIKEAKLKYPVGDISSCCKGISKQAGGYKWAYYKN